MTRVIKIGGRAQNDPALIASIAALHTRGEKLCVVHGGGDEVSALQRTLGHEPRFVQGRRATTADEVAVVRMVLSGTINKRLVAQLLTSGVNAVGISGEDANLLSCHLFDGGSLGTVGEPAQVNPLVIHTLLNAGFLPVVSPVGRLIDDGSGCNVNGDDAAAAIAAALGATDLLMVADVAGVMHDDGHVISQLDRNAARWLITSGVARGGMIAKLNAALRALAAGAQRVRIGNASAIGDLSLGTTIVFTSTKDGARTALSV